jgi:hypothetical protein
MTDSEKQARRVARIEEKMRRDKALIDALQAAMKARPQGLSHHAQWDFTLEWLSQEPAKYGAVIPWVQEKRDRYYALYPVTAS